MFTAWLRKTFGRLLDTAGRLLARMGISANALTIIGCLLNVIVGVAIAMGYLRLGGAGLLFASIFDAFDGTVARQVGRPTKFGAFLDSVLDRVSESAILLGLAWWYMAQGVFAGAILAYITIVGSLLVSYARARAEGLGVDCKVGLLTRVERCLILILALLFGLTYPALWVLAVGTLATSLHRVVSVYRQLGDTPLHAPDEPVKPRALQPR